MNKMSNSEIVDGFNAEDGAANKISFTEEEGAACGTCAFDQVIIISKK